MGLRKKIKKTVSKSVSSVVSKTVDVISIPTKYVVDKTSLAGKYINYSVKANMTVLSPVYGIRLIRDFFNEDSSRIIEEFKTPLTPEVLQIREVGRLYPPFRDWAFSKTSAPPRFISARKSLSFSHFGARYGKVDLYLVPLGYNKPRPMIQHSYNADICTSILSNKEGVICFAGCIVNSNGSANFGLPSIGAHANPTSLMRIEEAFTYSHVTSAVDMIDLYLRLSNNPKFLGGLINLNDSAQVFPYQGSYQYICAVIKDDCLSAYPEAIKFASNHVHASKIRGNFPYFQQLNSFVKESFKESVIHYDECILNK